MQKQIGITIYLGASNLQENRKYLQRASTAGFKRVYVDCNKNNLADLVNPLRDLTNLLETAYKEGLETHLITGPNLFKLLEEEFLNKPGILSFLAKHYVHAVNFVHNENPHHDAQFSQNKFGIECEINASRPPHYPQLVLNYGASYLGLIASFNRNFAPHTGLPFRLFGDQLVNHNRLGINLNVFVSHQQQTKMGSDVSENNTASCPTLELHRSMPLEYQIRHFVAMRTIAGITIGNSNASEEDFRLARSINLYVPSLKINLDQNIPANERQLVLDTTHEILGTSGEVVVRSTVSAQQAVKLDLPARHTSELNFKRGDVLLANDTFGRYKGELHILQQGIPNDGHYNYVGNLAQYEERLMYHFRPWTNFTLHAKDLA